MGLRDKYAYAIQQAKGKFDGSAQERDGKLLLHRKREDGSREERALERHQDDPGMAR